MGNRLSFYFSQGSKNLRNSLLIILGLSLALSMVSGISLYIDSYQKNMVNESFEQIIDFNVEYRYDSYKENYKIMQLYSPLVSPQNRDKIKQVISNYPQSFSKTEIRKMMLIDGFPELNWDGLFAFFNKITLTKRP